VIKAIINWGAPQTDNKVPPGAVPLNPTFKEKHIVVTNWLRYGPGESPLSMSMTQLSHLEVLPQAMIEGQQTWAPSVVLTVRSHAPANPTNFNQEIQSIVDRWEVLVDQPQKLHPAFIQLGAKTGQGSTPVSQHRFPRPQPAQCQYSGADFECRRQPQARG
jgi:mediator of RNA polymerase II transcription subunit 16